MNIFRHIYMVIAEIVTLLLYAISIVFLPEYFGAFLQFICKLSPSLSIASVHSQTFHSSSLSVLFGR